MNAEAPRIADIRAEPGGDRRRVAVSVELEDLAPPYPYLELVLLDPDDDPIGEMLVLGVMEPALQLTLVLRRPVAAEDDRPFRALGRLFYGEEGKEEETFSIAETTFTWP